MFVDAYITRLLKEWEEVCLKVKIDLERLRHDIPIVLSGVQADQD